MDELIEEGRGRSPIVAALPHHLRKKATSFSRRFFQPHATKLIGSFLWEEAGVQPEEGCAWFGPRQCNAVRGALFPLLLASHVLHSSGDSQRERVVKHEPSRSGGGGQRGIDPPTHPGRNSPVERSNRSRLFMSINAAFLSTGIGSVSEGSWTPEGAAMSIMSPFVSSERGSSPLEWSEGDTTKEGTSRTMTMAE